MKYEAISTYKPEFSVGKMCRVLGLKEANYYCWQRYRSKKDIQRLKELQQYELVESVLRNPIITGGKADRKASRRTAGKKSCWL